MIMVSVLNCSQKKHLLGPAYVEHLQIVFNDADLLLLVRLVEVLQNDGDVHVNHDHVADYDEAGEIGNCQQWMATIAVLLVIECGIAVWRLYHQRLQHIVPSGRSHEPANESPLINKRLYNSAFYSSFT